MTRFQFIGLFLILSLGLQAQDFDHYQPLKSSGELPERFVALTKSSVEAELDQLEKEKKGKSNEAEEQFVVESNYLLNQLLLSGRVLFNDPLSNYLNRVAQQVIAHNPGLRDPGQVQVYVIKSTVVNAFAYDNGNIFITLGLIANLDNEAQLAYVFAHELTHFDKKHSMNNYIEDEDIREGHGKYSDLSPEDQLIASSNFSKDLELMADSLGYEMLKSTNYDPESAFGAFDVLKYSYLPFDEVKIPKSYFEDEYLVFPEEHFLKQVSAIEVKENDDSLGTHPDINIRIEKLSSFYKKSDSENKKKYVVSEEEFQITRTTARFELCRLYLQQREYPRAIYDAFILQQQYPNSVFLKEVIAKSLYNLTAYKYAGQRWLKVIVEDPENIQGQSQQLYHFFRQLDKEEMNVLALRYNWKQKKAYPQNPGFARLSDSLIKMLVFEENLYLKDFSMDPMDTTLADARQKEEQDISKLNKYEKIERQRLLKRREKQEEEFKYTRHAFTDFLQEDEFQDKFSSYQLQKYQTESQNRKNRLTPSDQRLKQNTMIEIFGQALGVDTIVIVDPFYIKLDLRKEHAAKYMKSELNQVEFMARNLKIADKVGLSVKLIDPHTFASTDMDLFNEMCVLNEWVQERLEHKDDAKYVVVSTSEYLRPIIEKFNTRYFMWTGLYTGRIKKTMEIGLLVGSVFIPYLLPYTIYAAITPGYSTIYYSILMDLETGQIRLSKIEQFNSTDRNDLLNAQLYDTYFQIHHSR